MKSFAATLMLLAATASYVVSLPAQPQANGIALRAAYNPGKTRITIHIEQWRLTVYLDVVVVRSPEHELLARKKGKAAKAAAAAAAAAAAVRIPPFHPPLDMCYDAQEADNIQAANSTAVAATATNGTATAVSGKAAKASAKAAAKAAKAAAKADAAAAAAAATATDAAAAAVDTSPAAVAAAKANAGAVAAAANATDATAATATTAAKSGKGKAKVAALIVSNQRQLDDLSLNTNALEVNHITILNRP
jgi:hypothetical protein